MPVIVSAIPRTQRHPGRDAETERLGNQVQETAVAMLACTAQGVPWHRP